MNMKYTLLFMVLIAIGCKPKEPSVNVKLMTHEKIMAIYLNGYLNGGIAARGSSNYDMFELNWKVDSAIMSEKILKHSE